MKNRKTHIVRDRHGLWTTQEMPPVTLARESGRFVYYAPGERYDGLVYCYDNQDDIIIKED